MNTKTVGLVILVIGLLMTLYTGFNYVTREKVVDLGSIEITADKEHSLPSYFSPQGLNIDLALDGLCLSTRTQDPYCISLSLFFPLK